MKIIFLSVFQSFVARNILNTGVLDELISQGNKVVLFVPPAKLEFYKEAYKSPQVFIESIDVSMYGGKTESFFAGVAELLTSTNAMQHRKIKRFQQSGRFLKYLFEIGVTAGLGKSTLVKSIFRGADLKLNRSDVFGPFFEKYKPDVVFATDVFGIGDISLLKSANKWNVRSVGMVASWDNNTTKGLMRVIPDILLVQNRIIEEETISIQSVPAEIIKIVGIAHYDFYLQYDPISRDEYFKKMHLSLDKRLIVFSPAGSKFISTDWQICQVLKDAYSSGKLPSNVVTLIRVHPTNPVDFGSFEPDENFIVEKPGVIFGGLSEKRKELDKTALLHLLDTLNHADLVINVLSSIVIDASVFDKPVITVGFEGWEKHVPFGSSVKRYHLDENMKTLLGVGGTKIARSPEELIESINFYLKNKNHDHEGRKRIIDQQIWKLDGMAKKRIAESLISEYKE